MELFFKSIKPPSVGDRRERTVLRRALAERSTEHHGPLLV